MLGKAGTGLTTTVGTQGESQDGIFKMVGLARLVDIWQALWEYMEGSARLVDISRAV